MSVANKTNIKRKSTQSGSVSNFGGLTFGLKGRKNTKNMTSVSISEVEYRSLCRDINARISENKEVDM